jgi:hypothetical protein
VRYRNAVNGRGEARPYPLRAALCPASRAGCGQVDEGKRVPQPAHGRADGAADQTSRVRLLADPGKVDPIGVADIRRRLDPVVADACKGRRGPGVRRARRTGNRCPAHQRGLAVALARRGIRRAGACSTGAFKTPSTAAPAHHARHLDVRRRPFRPSRYRHMTPPACSPSRLVACRCLVLGCLVGMVGSGRCCFPSAGRELG